MCPETICPRLAISNENRVKCPWPQNRNRFLGKSPGVPWDGLLLGTFGGIQILSREENFKTEEENLENRKTVKIVLEKCTKQKKLVDFVK